MAKKKTTGATLTGEKIPASKLTEKDKKTLGSLTELADEVVAAATKSKTPHMDVPSRSLSNVKYNNSKRYIEMGSGTNRRELFNLSQAKAYMQSLMVASGTKQLIDRGKTSSLRGLFYMMKHTIEGTSEETFSEQSESDTIIEDIEVTLNALREEMHLYAEKRGEMVGPLLLNDSGDDIDCSRMGSGGYGIPSIVESDRITFKKSEAQFILHVEKGTVWQRFNEDKFWRKHNCILTHGAGQPPRGVRRMLHRLHHELTPGGIRKSEKQPPLPIYCLLDNDPWGYYIYSVIKQGSINLAYESKRMSIPDAKFMGLRSSDYERCKLTPSVQIKLNDTDKKRANQIKSYPWFKTKNPWQKEIDLMLKNGFKLEVEALISKDISYVTDTYVPERLTEKEIKLFLD
jgi:DNA topoisomerase-6 subunit A